MAILRRFLPMSGAPRVRGIARGGFTVRLGRYLRHGGEKERYGSGYFCGMSREVRVRGDYGNLLRSLRFSFGRELKGTTM